jgi:hypothetical protein
MPQVSGLVQEKLVPQASGLLQEKLELPSFQSQREQQVVWVEQVLVWVLA